jgi:DNA-binding NtrC family response regulator
MKKRIIVVDDEPRISNSLEMILSEKGYDVTKATSGKEAIDFINREDYDLVIADLILPGMTGLELLKSVKKSHPMLPVFIVTTFATINAAVLAMKEGAEDFVTKPILESEIKLKIDRTIERYQVLQENIRLREEVRRKYSSEEQGYASGVMQEIYRKIEQYSKNERPIFILGENGTGKETIAKSIHFNSSRSRKPFIKVDVSIIPRNIQVKKIFGGLSGGRSMREVVVPGEVDLANEGAIYFEHVELLQPESQSRLHRLMVEGMVDRGDDGSVDDTLDLRIICSSTVDLGLLMEEGKFKVELRQHLIQSPIMVPPLRDRKEDILPLVTTFIKKWSDIHHKAVKQISQEALELLYAYHWPGNIRERMPGSSYSRSRRWKKSTSPEFSSTRTGTRPGHHRFLVSTGRHCSRRGKSSTSNKEAKRREAEAN